MNINSIEIRIIHIIKTIIAIVIDITLSIKLELTRSVGYSRNKKQLTLFLKNITLMEDFKTI